MDNWLERAACDGLDPAIFFPDKSGQGNLQASKARKVCNMCPVQEECLKYALDNNEKWGIWGGKTEKERRKLKKNYEQTR